MKKTGHSSAGSVGPSGSTQGGNAKKYTNGSKPVKKKKGNSFQSVK